MTSPHHWSGILESASDAVGNTPLINLSRLARSQGVKCNILAKVEFFSAGGSIKDRIAKRMIERAERDGRLIPGKSVIIEPTSGNTGIGLALLASLKGYKAIITLPAKMSKEKEAVLKSLGAEVVRTPTEAGWEDPTSHIQIAKKLEKTIPNGVILDQYCNLQNPLAHYYSTFGEIAHSISTSRLQSRQIDALIAGAGTGGTITGLSRALRDWEQGIYPRPEAEAEKEVTKSEESFKGEKDMLKKVNGVKINGHAAEDDEVIVGDERRTLREGKGIVVGVDPEGSILGGGQVGNYVIEGIGYDFFPEVLDPTERCIDHWIKTDDEEAYEMVRAVMRTESLLVGGSSGSALAGLFKFLRSEVGQKIAQDETKNVVVILADGVRNYISKDWFLNPVLEAPTSKLGSEIEAIIGRPMGDAYGTLSNGHAR